MPIVRNTPNYKNFLDTIEENPKEVEKYFDSLIFDLENEKNSLIKEKDESITEYYNDFSNSLDKFDKIKFEILEKYFIEFKEINEKYNKDLSELEAEYLNKKHVLENTIYKENYIINLKKRDLLLELYEEKKPYQDKINKVQEKIDEEYIVHSKTIFDAKEKILKNSEYYLNSDFHLKDLDKTIVFLKELLEFNENLVNEDNKTNIESDTNKLNIYIEYINDEKKNLEKYNDLYQKYEFLENTISSFEKEFESKINISKNENKELSIELHKSTEKIDEEIKSIINYFKKIDTSSYSSKDLDKLNKKMELLLDNTLKKKENLILSYSIESDLIKKKESNLVKYKDELLNLSSSIKTGFNNEIKKNTSLLKETLNLLLDLLNLELQNIKQFKKNTKDSREIVEFFKQKYKKLEIEKRIIILENYRDSLKSSNNKSKELDILAFELLTNEELLKLEQLDLKKEYLTIDDSLMIKRIEYDFEIKEIEKCMDQNLVIKNTTNQLELLKKDLEIDKNILKNELENDIYILDLKKKIDILSSDYMVAYTRLDNVSRIIELSNDKDIKIENLNTNIKLEKIIELSLLNAISKKNEYKEMIYKYQRDIESLDIDTKQKIRYLSNVLEIEKNNFENNKKELQASSKELEKLLYPDIQNKKYESSILINSLKRSYKHDKLNLDKIKKKDESIIPNIKEKYSNIKNDKLSNLIQYFDINDDKNIDNFIIYADKIIDEINSLLNEVSYKGNFALNKKVFKLMHTSNALSKLSKDNFEQKSKQIILSLVKNITKNFDKAFDSINILTDKEIENKKCELDNELKFYIAMIAIQNTERLEDNLSELDSLRLTRKKLQENLEKEIIDYQKSYVSTIETIKKEYNEKLSQLNSLKEYAIEHSTISSSTIDNLINEAYEKVINQELENKESILRTGEENLLNTKNKIDSLNENMKEKSILFEQESKNKVIQNEDFRNRMIIEAKEYFQKIEKEKENAIESLRTIQAEKELNKPTYIKEITLNALDFKEKYEDTNKELENSKNQSKLNKTLEYGKLFNELSQNETDIHKDISSLTKSFDEQVKIISKALLRKTSRLTHDLSIEYDNSIDEYLKMLNKKINEIDRGAK